MLDLVWSKEVTAFLCGCIAADGWITVEQVFVIGTSDEKRAEEVRDVLRDAGLKVTISGQGTTGFGEKKLLGVYLRKTNGQYGTFYWSIKKYGMEKWLGRYKLEKLEKKLGLDIQHPLMEHLS